MGNHFKISTAAHIFFVRDNEVLLLRRFNTGYRDGEYSLIAGHVDEGESLRKTAVREAREEVEVDIDSGNLDFVLVIHKKEDDERLAFFFEAKKWRGEPVNAEPEKCDDLRWFPLDGLPENTIPYIKNAIECYREKVDYSEFGWKS